MREISLAGQALGVQPSPRKKSDLIPLPTRAFLLGPGFPSAALHSWQTRSAFRPTPNLEFGMGVTAIFGGPGLPFTWHEFFRSYYGHNVSTATNPGKRFFERSISPTGSPA